jgi:hypothetical protein
MTVRRIATALLGSVLLWSMSSVPPAAAASAAPAVGECYLVTDKQTFDDYWPGVPAVPCTSKHSLQITTSSVLPADVNAVTFATDHCAYPDVWKSAGVNQAKKGIVERPLRFDAFYFVVREPGVPASYVCAIGPILQRGKKDAQLVTTTNAVGSLTAKQKAALQFCSGDLPGAPLNVPAVTVPCSKTPRWQVTRWIMWDDFYSTYPGEAVLTARAKRLCGPGTTPSVPSVDVWPGGTHRSWCYKKHT